jgi:hypothetical protein
MKLYIIERICKWEIEFGGNEETFDRKVNDERYDSCLMVGS